MNHVYSLLFLLMMKYLLLVCHAGQLTSTATASMNRNIHASVSVLNVCGTKPNFEVSFYKNLLSFQSSNRSPQSSTFLSLADAYRVCSRNRSKVHITMSHTEPIQILNSCYYANTLCMYEDWANEADRFVISKSQNGMFHTKQPNISIYIIPEIQSCNWAGLGYMSCADKKNSRCRIWIQGQASQYIDTYLHEIGHTLGLTHASSTSSEYGDATCAMGLCCWPRCYNAPHLEQLQWASSVRVIKVSNVVSKKQQILYEYLSDARSTTNDITYLRIETPTQWIYVEYRARSHSIDIGLPNRSVNIYASPPGNSKGSITTIVGSLTNMKSTWTHSFMQISVTVASQLSDYGVMVLLSIGHQIRH